jgi:hypothetical protein
MFYLASGSVHVRLTDAGGVALFDYPSMLVIGPSGGGGGGGPVDPTTVMSTGDIKFRATGETLTGWVKMNATTIGNATSGATQRANADTQALYVYLWMNCAQNHCPVIGGQGGSALADFNASKPIQLPDWRGTGPMGLDDMGNSARGLVGSVNMTAPDTPTTPNGVGGEAIHLQQIGEMPSHTHAVSGGINDPGHTHDVHFTASSSFASTGATQAVTNISSGGASVGTAAAASHTTGITLSSLSAGFTGGGTPFNVMSPFMLGSWYIKL